MRTIMWYAGWRTVGGLLVVAMIASALSAPQPPIQEQPIGPTTSQSAVDQQRLNDLIAVVEGQNSPQARRTGARELLRCAWPEAVPRMAAILRGANRPAKVAVALALSDLPECLVADYTEPLLAMLADGEAEVRLAAAAALATSSEDDVLARLSLLALDSDQALEARLAAIDTLGMMTRRDAIAVLIDALAKQDSPLAAPALAALERATGQDFQGDFDAALAWWTDAGQTSSAVWHRMQIARLVRQSRAKDQRLQDLEQRLANALRENYVRTPEAQRPALLRTYLADVCAAVRCLGLELVQSALAEGKTLMPETVAHTRELLAAPEPLVRAAAVRTIATLRDPGDAERFWQLLAREHHRDVRAALANGLGYVGTASAAAPLLTLLESHDQIISNAAVTALGRLSERGVLDQPTRAQIASALTARMRLAPVDAHATRERLLWAMSRVGDPRFGAQFVAALDTPDSVAVRLAAVRGIAVMADPRTIKANGQTSQPAPGTVGAGAEGEVLSPRELVDALVPLASDPDAGVRRAAVETLAQFATSDAHVEALWARLAADREPEEGIRMAAWRGAVRVIAGRSVDAIESWLERLPGDEAAQRGPAAELLQAAEQNLASKPDRRAESGRVRVRLAAELAALNQIEPAIATYLLAVDDLHAASSPQIAPVALELLRLALLNDRYDAQLAAALAQVNPALDGQALWEGVAGEIEQRLQPDEVDCAITMLAALQANPPTSMPADTQQALQDMLERAREVQAAADAALVGAALDELCEKPDDEQARQTILNLGSRAAPTVRDALREALHAEQPDANQIQRLYDLLETLVPDWPGFASDAAREEKLNALDALTAE